METHKDIRTVTRNNNREIPSLRQLQLHEVKESYPEFFREGVFCPDIVANLLQPAREDAKEKYSFCWAGRSGAEALLTLPAEGSIILPNSECLMRDRRHVLISGDNFRALQLLQKSYHQRVDCIYIDPPYNTGNDFIYNDNFSMSLAAYLAATQQVDQEGNILVSNPESSGRFHSLWLSMMYPRLTLAHDLLTHDGVIFVSIDDHEVHHLIMLMNEIFGEENAIGVFTWLRKKKGSHLSGTFRSLTEYVVCYARSKDGVRLYGENAYTEKLQPLAKRTNAEKTLTFPKATLRTTLPDALYSAGNYGKGTTSLDFLSSFTVANGIVTTPLSIRGRFVWTQSKLDDEIKNGSTVWLSRKYGLNVARFDQSEKVKRPPSLLDNSLGIGTNEDATAELEKYLGVERLLDYPKPVSLVKYLVRSATYDKPEAVVLDFFAGSGTTGQAVVELNEEMHHNKRYILVQYPEPTKRDDFATVYDICRQRLLAASPGTSFLECSIGASSFRPAPTETDQMAFVYDSIVDGANEYDLLLELMLRHGIPLDADIEQLDIEGIPMHLLRHDDLQTMVSFASDIRRIWEQIPFDSLTHFICRDAAVSDEQLMSCASTTLISTI